MSVTVPIVLFGWPLVVIVLFATVRPRIAAMTAFLGAWLFLPMADYEFSGLPGYGKMEAASYGALLGMLLFDPSRLRTLRLTWLDIPIIVWCLTPMASSLTNGLGAYDGASSVYGQTISWGVPYLMGRLYFSDLEGLRVLAMGVLVGGLLYVPLCLFEIRMSPRLHLWVYGFSPYTWGESKRMGGWRPTVFMHHGLAVGLWMTTASLVALWMWWTGAVRRIRSIPTGYIVAAMIGTTVLCKSAGAIALLAMGAGALAVMKKLRSGVLLWLLVLLPLVYMGVRAPGLWGGSHLLDLVGLIVPSRQDSFRYRIEAEDLLSRHALRQPVFGWGGYSRNRPAEMGYEVKGVATDGLWIITLGQRGVVGLASMTATMMLPVLLMLHCLRADDWNHPSTAPLGVLAIVLTVFMIDNLFNAMPNPVYIVAAGGMITSLSVMAAKSHPVLRGIGLAADAQNRRPAETAR